MNFYLKKDKILSLHVKDKSCNSLEAQQLYQKRTSTQVFSCERLFYRTTPVAAFELSFSIRKEFKEKEASGEIDCLSFE